MKASLLAFYLLFCCGFLGAQNADSKLTHAVELYASDSYEKAFAAVNEAITETSDATTKTKASEVLFGIGLKEYDIKNYKNAYESFKRALKLNPSHAQSSAYFLKMRKEMDVTKLSNAINERPKPTPTPAIAVATAAPTSQASATDQPSSTALTSQAPAQSSEPALSNVSLKELQAALADAGSKLNSMSGSVSSTKEENRLLQSQVEQQLLLLKSLAASNAAANSNPNNNSKVDNQSKSEQDALFIKTMELLTRIAEKEDDPTKVVVQSDPALKEMLARTNSVDSVLVVIVIVVSVFLVLLVFLIMMSVNRARKRRMSNNDFSRANNGFANSAPSAMFISANQEAMQTNLLGYVDSNQSQSQSNDVTLQRDLLKADRLNKMYEEVRQGRLSWNTVRQYIGELEISLKGDILKCVERKLDDGDLISPQAILPVIFPFLTDYDDFVREKAEKLSERALHEGSKSSSSNSSALGIEGPEVTDPLSISNLMEIPQKLQQIFKNQEQTLMTAKICRGMGAALGLSPDERNLLYKSALAHDCGYLLLDKEKLTKIISKPEIDDEDFKFIQSHAIKGPEFFGEIDLPEPFKFGILYHHERNDGTGYPDGLKKAEIPVFAKIIGIAETFAALISKRSYRDKRDVAHALAIISDGARAKFDASHVEALVKVANSMGAM